MIFIVLLLEINIINEVYNEIGWGYMNELIDDTINKMKFKLNEKILIIILISNSISILLSIFLANLFINSMIASFCGIIIGVTLGVVINYFILTRYKLLEDINIGFIQENIENEIEEFRTIMK